MSRSTKESWLQGPGDLKEEDVEDVPVLGESVKIKALSAAFSARLLDRLNITKEGRQEVGDVAFSEGQVLQFQAGVVEPKFTIEEVRQLAEKYGPAFNKVNQRINALSGVDEGAIKTAADRFPVGRNGSDEPGRGELGADAAVAAGPGDRPDLGV